MFSRKCSQLYLKLFPNIMRNIWLRALTARVPLTQSIAIEIPTIISKMIFFLWKYLSNVYVYEEKIKATVFHFTFRLSFFFFLYNESRKARQTCPFNINGFLKCMESCWIKTCIRTVEKQHMIKKGFKEMLNLLCLYVLKLKYN